MMPLYTYRCTICDHDRQEFRKIADRDRAPECDRETIPEDLGEDEESMRWTCGHEMQRIIEAPMVAPDIGPYQAVAVDVATGKPPVINSRSAHRDFLKRNGYTEVGNERVGRKPGEVRGDFNLRKELTKATREVLGRGK
jgi:hypothetical protein